jgi:hypothetical protein
MHSLQHWCQGAWGTLSITCDTVSDGCSFLRTRYDDLLMEFSDNIFKVLIWFHGPTVQLLDVKWTMEEVTQFTHGYTHGWTEITPLMKCRWYHGSHFSRYLRPAQLLNGNRMECSTFAGCFNPELVCNVEWKTGWHFDGSSQQFDASMDANPDLSLGVGGKTSMCAVCSRESLFRPQRGSVG